MSTNNTLCIVYTRDLQLSPVRGCVISCVRDFLRDVYREVDPSFDFTGVQPCSRPTQHTPTRTPHHPMIYLLMAPPLHTPRRTLTTHTRPTGSNSSHREFATSKADQPLSARRSPARQSAMSPFTGPSPPHPEVAQPHTHTPGCSASPEILAGASRLAVLLGWRSGECFTPRCSATLRILASSSHLAALPGWRS